MKRGQEVPRQLVIPRGDTTEMFEVTEEVFNEMTGFIQIPVIVSTCFTAGPGRDDNLDSGVFQGVTDLAPVQRLP